MVRVVYTPEPSAPSPREERGPVPLSHHEILGLVGPFTHRDRHVDLAASDRRNRSLTFKPRLHADLPEPGAALTEVLVLENPAPEQFRLVRTLTGPEGLQARAEIEGTDIELMLQELDKVDPQRQFSVRAGVPIARSYRIEPRAAGEDGHPEPRWRAVLTGAQADIDEIVLSVKAKTGRGMPADLELRATEERELRLPQDLLAVLGWDWRPMRRFGKGWRGSVRLPKQEPTRTSEAEIKINRSVEHLAKTLRRPPGDFHSRWRSARWKVTFRRAIPLLTGLTILAATPLIQFFSLEDQSLVRMMIFHAPPILLVGMFMFKEMPVIEIPPLPRRLIGRSWIKGGQPIAGVSSEAASAAEA